MSEFRYQIKSVLDNVLALVEELEANWVANGLDKDTVFALRTAFQEAVVNAVKHGNKQNPKTTVDIIYRLSDSQLEIEITDEGEGFDYSSLPDPRNKDQIMKLGGKGVFMMKKFMDRVEFIGKGNRVKMVKLRNLEGASKMIEDILVFKPGDEINANSTGKLRKVFDEIINSDKKKVVVDLSGIEYIDSAGLAILIEFFQRLQKNSGKLHICGLSSKISKIFEVAKLNSIFKIYDSFEKAYKGF